MESANRCLFIQYCEQSSCQGIGDWYVAKSFLGKAFWAILIIAGLGITTFQTYGMFKEFLNDKEYKITISKEIENDGIPFPFITICNFNRAKQSVINQTGIDPKVLSYVFQLFPTFYDIPLSILEPDEISTYQKAWDDYNGEKDIRKFLQQYGYSDKDIIMLVTFGNGIIVKNFTEVFTVYGRCWRVTVDGKQTMPGSFAGVKMMLNPQLDEYMKDVIFNNYYQQGFAISLSYSDTEPIMSDTLLLSPGTSSHIVITASRKTVMDTSFPIRPKPCKNNASLKIIKAAYTQGNCLYDCYIQGIFDKCGCTLLAETQKILPLCNLTTAINCSAPFSGQHSIFTEKILPGMLGCAKTCDNPCDDFMSIEAAMSTTKLNIIDKDNAIKIVQKMGSHANWTYEFVKQGVENNVMANIYFTSLEMSIVEKGESTPIMAFIGNVGGQLGLWMGISMFTVIQLFYYIFLGCLNKEKICDKKKKKSKKQSKIADSIGKQ